MSNFIKNAINFEINALNAAGRTTDAHEAIANLAKAALEFGFLSSSSLVSDNEFVAFKEKTGATNDDIRTVIHGLERLSNADAYSSSRVYFFHDCLDMFNELKSDTDEAFESIQSNQGRNEFEY